MSAESHLGLAAVPADPLGNEIPPLAVHDPLPDDRLPPLLFSLPLLPHVSWTLHTEFYILTMVSPSPPLAIHDPLPEGRLPLLFSLPILPHVSWALHTELYKHSAPCNPFCLN
jgi:hypothetical protein